MVATNLYFWLTSNFWIVDYFKGALIGSFILYNVL